jgi:hypothetical protein
MSIHSLPDVPGVDVHELIAREMAGQFSREAQDDLGRSLWDEPEDAEDDPVLIERQDRKKADAIYFRTLRREGLQAKRRFAVS